MENQSIILIADSNPRVRKYIERELAADGYRIYTVDTCRNLFKWLSCRGLSYLLILDPDLPDMDMAGCIKLLQARHSDLSIILHGYGDDCRLYAGQLPDLTIIEKSGSSVDALKCKVRELTYTKGEMKRRSYDERARPNHGPGSGG